MSCCASPVTFQALYGAENDGNVCNPANIADFKKKVLHETQEKGVHFMMADGVIYNIFICVISIYTTYCRVFLLRETKIYRRFFQNEFISLSAL